MFSDTEKTLNYLNEISAIHEAFECSREAINGVLLIIDQDWHTVLQAIREKWKTMARSSGVQMYQNLDPSLLPYHTLSRDRSDDMQLDDSGYARGWSGVHATGNYEEGGELWIPALNLKLRFLPGMLRGDFIYISSLMSCPTTQVILYSYVEPC